MKLLFDDDISNSNPHINSKHNILFIKIDGEKGMKTVNIKKYTEGVKNLKKVDTVYFDWDLTLSIQPSIDILEYYKHRSISKNKYIKNLNNYFGSLARRNALRILFRTIRRKGGDIKVLTRNPTAYLKKEQIFFPEMINSLEGNRTFTLKDLHYCDPNISKSAYIRKLNTNKLKGNN